jgi:hypothetical protein
MKKLERGEFFISSTFFFLIFLANSFFKKKIKVGWRENRKMKRRTRKEVKVNEAYFRW